MQRIVDSLNLGRTYGVKVGSRMRKRDAVAHIVEHEHDKSIEYSVDHTAPTA